MIEPDSIPRRKAGDVDHGFERLRAEAIELVQEISGQLWTDYNLHDPGITILEQLIYAITDLSYRCKFALQDYLADADGEFDPAAQALHSPAEIFSCRASTPADYRKLLLDAMPQIDDARFDAVAAAGVIRGLYEVSVKLSRDHDAQDRDIVSASIREHFNRARNLCEDLGAIRVLDNVGLELHAEIEVDSGFLPADILGDIYFECERRIARGAMIENYEQVDVERTSLDRLFDGPLTEHGFFAQAERQQAGISVSSLISIINGIGGVRQIQLLYLERNGQKYFDLVEPAKHDEAYDLELPASDDAIGVCLYTNGRRLPLSIEDVRARYEERRSRYFASRSADARMELLYRPPQASPRAMDAYFSIQNQFPANYGVNRYGVPDNASPQVKARVRQLKGYLLIFEQFLVNFLGNLDSLGELFSPRTESGRSYATGLVEAEQVSDLENLYPAEAETIFGGIVAGFDNYYQRKGRVLDYLLALYGERFSQNSLRHFNFYYGREEVDAVIVANKVAYLENIVQLGRDRAAAPDYADESIYQQSGLARRARLLLDLGQQEWITDLFDRRQIRICTQREYRQQFHDGDALRLVEKRAIDAERYWQPAQTPLAQDSTLEELQRELPGIAPLANGLVSDSLLHGGIDMARYRVGRENESESYRLYFELDETDYWMLGSYDSEAAAEQAANRLRRFLLLLNRGSEGLHVVEHLMLRPRKVDDVTDAADFYSFRISVVLPGWSKRCENPEFRKLVRETLRLIAPAHLFSEFYWLDFSQMCEFEKTYRAWMQLKCNRDASPDELDRHAYALRDFLVAARPTQQSEMWFAS